jgi:phosphorylcholine metabolism protein LicD
MAMMSIPIFTLSIILILVLVIVHIRFGLPYISWYLRMRAGYHSHLADSRQRDDDGRRIVVSMSSMPSRLAHAFPTINSLLLQSVPPDVIYLNLPMHSLREGRSYDVPTALNQDSRVIINRCAIDSGPITKLIPTLHEETDPDTLIITVDDDTVYHPHMIRALISYHGLHPRSALGFRGWKVPKSGLYRDSRTIYARDTKVPLSVDILTGVSGVMYERWHFEADFLDREALPPESFFVDDICISGYLAQRRVPRLIIPFKLREPLCRFIRSSRSNPLWRVNKDGHNNQVMLHRFFDCPSVADPPKPFLLGWYDRFLFPILQPVYSRIFCTHNQYLWRKTPPPQELRRILLMLLRNLDRYFEAIQVTYWLDWGTLLGCVRGGKMIPWDDDIDVGIRHSDHNSVLEHCDRLPAELEILEISRFWPYQKLLPFLKRFPRKTFLRLVHRPSGLFIDIFEYLSEDDDYRLLPWVPWQRTRSIRDQGVRMHAHHKDWVLPVRRGTFEGLELPIPRQPERILTAQFGEDYLTPDHRWDEGLGKWLPTP